MLIQLLTSATSSCDMLLCEADEQRSYCMLIDTHVHLDDLRYDADRDAVFQRAEEA